MLAVTDPAPRVTAVIPVWGAYADHRLDEAIASLRAQDFPLEILLVDNAHSPPLHRTGAASVRSDRRLSLGSARNLGLEAVRTPLVLFWDADDVMPAGTLRRLVAELDRDPGMTACGAAMTDGPTGDRHHWPRRWPLVLRHRPRLFAFVNAISSLYPVTGAVVRTAAARDSGFPDVSGGDDWAMGVSLAFRGRVGVLSEPGRVYRRHNGSVSSTWGAGDALAHGRVVRDRLREDPAVPAAVRRLEPAVRLGQEAVVRLLRPIGRRMPRRRREGI